MNRHKIIYYMNNRFDNISDNISIIQNISYIVEAFKSYPFFLNHSVVIAQSNIFLCV